MNQLERYEQYCDCMLTFAEIGELEGITRQRAHQVALRLIPDWKTRGGYNTKVRKQREEIAARKEIKHGKRHRAVAEWGYDMWLARREKFQRKRVNARHCKWEFSIDFYDIEWPTHCPLLGLELDYFCTSTQENSVSFDRIDPSKGYVQGNVLVCSWRANRIKNDATSSELRQIADNLDKLNKV